MLPQEKANEILQKFGYYVDEQGNIATNIITWEKAQKLAKASTKEQEKNKKNKKQSAKQSKLTYKTNKNIGRR